MIQPTPGRVVWYTPDAREGFTILDEGVVCAATVAYVHNDRLVNLTVHDHLGVVHSLQRVPLVQPEDGRSRFDGVGGFCEWMPYQKGQSPAADTKVVEPRSPGAA